MANTNDEGGWNLFMEEPLIECPECGGNAAAEFTDNGFGPYSVQVSPYRCSTCGWDEETNMRPVKHRSSGVLISIPKGAEVVNGTVLYALDYFFFARQEAHIVDTTLVLYGWTDEQVRELDIISQTRYGAHLFHHPVERVSELDELMWLHFDNIMINAFDYEKVKTRLSAKTVWMTHSHVSMDMGDVAYMHDVVPLNECAVIGPVNYLKKIWFEPLDMYAEIEWGDAAYVNLSAWRYVAEDRFHEIEEMADGKKLIVHGDQSQDYSFVEERGHKLVVGHVEGLHRMFDTLIYFVENNYDYAPRMLAECAYLGKAMIVQCENGLEDGFASRWSTIMSGYDHLERKYGLTKDDVVMRHFARAREAMEAADE